MGFYKFELSDWDREMGVTEESVAEVLPKVLFRRNELLILPEDVSPAVGSAVARCVFAGAEFEYKGFNLLGNPVYVLKGVKLHGEESAE